MIVKELTIILFLILILDAFDSDEDSLIGQSEAVWLEGLVKKWILNIFQKFF
ncbi:hypothetical protein SAMN05192557_0959 [Aliicoccus persicus]|uniref:Uncharacterized protein n=1 Tax=Aliicoccus persicus TaxID=930138 RepID=A0A662Z4S3_9STAP|nr:hypothetical protein SAMN05192557_0959 [Aliicoccus persicus]